MQPPTLAQAQERFLAHHRARNHSRKQLEHYAVTFRDFGRFLDATGRPRELASLTTPSFEAFAAYLKETPLPRPYRGTTRRSIVGVHGHLKDLRAFVRWLTEEELIDWRVRVPLPKLPKRLFPILDDDELVALFHAPSVAGKSEYAVRNRALLALLLDTGVRLGELAGLTPPDVLHGQYLRVVGKGDKERIVPFRHEAARLLADWLKARSALGATDAEPLFLLKYNGIKMLIRRLKRETGIDVFPHKIRHTTATKLVRAKVDLHSVKELLGHTQISTTEGYLSLSAEDLAAKHAEGSPFASIAPRLPVERQRARRRYRLQQGAE